MKTLKCYAPGFEMGSDDIGRVAFTSVEVRGWGGALELGRLVVTLQGWYSDISRFDTDPCHSYRK